MMNYRLTGTEAGRYLGYQYIFAENGLEQLYQQMTKLVSFLQKRSDPGQSGLVYGPWMQQLDPAITMWVVCK